MQWSDVDEDQYIQQEIKVRNDGLGRERNGQTPSESTDSVREQPSNATMGLQKATSAGRERW